MSAISQKLGKAWEACIRVKNEELREARKAVVHPSPPRIHMVTQPRAGKFTACFAGNGPPDFQGGFCHDGRAISFDAKATTADKFSLDAIELWQARDLEAISPMGFAFIALRFGRTEWVLPWWRALAPLYWRWQESQTTVRGEASLTAAQIAEIGWQMPAPGDWYHALPEEIRGKA